MRTVLSQDPPPGGFEVIVADGLSDDGSRDVLDRLAVEHARLRVVDNHGEIVSTGLNTAIRAARGDVIVRMDAHTQYASDYLVQCLAVLRETGADNVGGPWIAQGSTRMGRAIAAAFQSPVGCGGARGHDPRYEGVVDTVYLGCWPRGVFDRIGVFDEELVRNQDDELNYRLTRAGGKVWQSPRIRSWYTPRDSVHALMRQYLQYGYWKIRVLQKHGRPASIRHVLPGTFVAVMTMLLLLAPFSALARLGFVSVLMTYAAVIAVAAVSIAARKGWALLIPLLAVLPTLHLSYGIGFIWGSVDFVIRRKGANRRFVELTRS